MKALLPMLLLLTISSAASAQGLNLRWQDCAADGGVRNMVFACNSNIQSHVVVPSIVLSSPVPTPINSAVTVDFVAATSTWPAWWDFETCRSGSIRTSTSAVGPINCQFRCVSGINWFLIGIAGPNTARIQMGNTCSASMVAGTEYITGPLVINATRTVGTPSCDGCTTGMCIMFTSIRLGETLYTTPAGPNSNFITWQGGGSGPGGICEAATVTRRAVWGSVKALYR